MLVQAFLEVNVKRGLDVGWVCWEKDLSGEMGKELEEAESCQKMAPVRPGWRTEEGRKEGLAEKVLDCGAILRKFRQSQAAVHNPKLPIRGPFHLPSLWLPVLAGSVTAWGQVLGSVALERVWQGISAITAGACTTIY